MFSAEKKFLYSTVLSCFDGYRYMLVSSILCDHMKLMFSIFVISEIFVMVVMLSIVQRKKSICGLPRTNL